MENGFRFTCQASKYGLAGGLTVVKGWKIELKDGDERLPEFLNNPAFKRQRIHIADPVKEELPKKEPDKPEKSDGGDPPTDPDKEPDGVGKPEDWQNDPGVETLVELDQSVIKLLQEGGFATVKSIQEAGKEKLTQVKGIGDATADNILNAVKATSA